MSFTYRHRKEIIICSLSVLVLLGASIFVYKNVNLNKKKESKTKAVFVSKKKSVKKVEKNKNTTSSDNTYKVDIKGEVVNPGIYSLTSNSRVIDVINMAGGLSENADTTVINLSRKIKDEMVIIIYSKYQVNNFKKTIEEENKVIEKCVKPDENSLENDACIDKKEEDKSDNLTDKININTATLEEFKKLPGIGDSKANNIIKYREEHEKFNSCEEIKKVDGIGDNLYAQIEAYITIE